MNADTLAMLFGFNHHVLKVNTDGMNHDESLIQPRPAGNCVNWVLGHILVSRNQILSLAGAEAIWPADRVDAYKRGSNPMTDSGRAVALDTLLQDLDASQERLTAALARLTPEQLAAVDAQGSLEDKIAILHFHEAYHAGQVGLLRRLVGKQGAIR